MFFSISKDSDANFPHRFKLGKLYLNCDSGWNSKTFTNGDIAIFKGYADNLVLADNLEEIITSPYPIHTGNFCVIYFTNNTIYIKPSKLRGFPLYYTNNLCVTNLIKQSKNIWGNEHCTVSQDIDVTTTKFDPIGQIETSLLSEDSVVEEIHKLLYAKIQKLISQTSLPIQVFLTGGVDSMLVFSFIKSLTNNYIVNAGLHFEFDEFWCKNQWYIKKNYQFYNQLHHWNQSSALSSGAWGDECLLRGPTISNLLLMSHNTNMLEACASIEKAQQKHYFLSDSSVKVFKDQLESKKICQLVTNRRVLYKHVCDMIINDHQHWHLGNTLTYTPLFDLEIFKLMLRLPTEAIINQSIDSKITKKLIEKNDPSLLNYLSVDKNLNEYTRIWDLLNNEVDRLSKIN